MCVCVCACVGEVEEVGGEREEEGGGETNGSDALAVCTLLPRVST